jgi:hypothetical protein
MAKTLDLKDVVLKRIKKDYNKTFANLKKDILKTLNLGVSDSFDSKQGYEIFYTSNPKYGEGGKGFYAKVNLPNRMKKIVKLSN